MPILHIRALSQENPTLITAALKKTAKAISLVYGCSPQQVWVTWEEIQPGRYVEGENEVSMQQKETHPPVCELLCFEGRAPQEIEKLLEVAAKTLSRELGIQNNIFITYREVKSGEVIAGNGVIRK